MKNDATSRDMFQGRVGQHCGDLRHGAQAARWRRAPGGHATIEACGERQCAWVRVWSANGSLGARPSGARVRAWGRRLRVQYTRPGHRHAGAVPYSRQRTVRGDGVSACSTPGPATGTPEPCPTAGSAQSVGTASPRAVHPARPQARRSRALQQAAHSPWTASPRAVHPARPQARRSRALQLRGAGAGVGTASPRAVHPARPGACSSGARMVAVPYGRQGAQSVDGVSACSTPGTATPKKRNTKETHAG